MTQGSGLERFVRAQAGIYPSALAELQAGRKQTHWMWFVFPQIAGLGLSQTSRLYAIDGRDEAQAYLDHDLLGPRLRECTRAMLAHAGKRTPLQVLGPIDALKFRSSMTLFEVADGEGSVFSEALDELCGGERDAATLGLLDAP
ncbi:DUF1810 domain-containing protein [Aurantiacibacter sp. MUD11]|uniref:DUF1810 domain-containing protein n=1 Tax=Aurantiacibacter sp. MUD11 TaxID=3003265 RepID=UPI0022AAC87B|nr:DUF1810 domain-containing protein [Aurantiacibacter sp. MUD11]WAT17668.1 DUF1810 domain-containing protein [Aurantiacibacter sp. MUD11]